MSTAAKTPRKPTILVVDDTAENIDILKGTLKDDYTVRAAVNGELALRIAAIQPAPDLILLDVMMPGMSGHEVIQRLKANPETRDIPVIFITALNDMDSEIKGLALGAVDYISKPFMPAIVRRRARTHLELREARRQVEAQHAQLSREREIVEDIITRMRAASDFDDRGLRHLVTSVDRTNGDLLLAAYTPDGRQWVLVGDITGHGLPAAVAAPLLSYVFYRHARENAEAETTLEELNRVMCRQLPANIFIVATLVEISAARDRATVWNAGLAPGFQTRAGQAPRRVESRFVPLGVVTPLAPPGPAESIEAQAGDRLYFYSDGAIEIQDATGEQFGVARMEAFIESLADPARTLDDLIDELAGFQGSRDFADDITLVEITF